ncbi:MAG TPA: glycosyltransferase [Pirellulales bacterium]
MGSSLCVVFSRVQIRLQAEYLDVPENRFVFVPYKANHSQSQPIAIVPGNYVFSGGNTKRDYATLCEAVRGTGIPVMISATDPAVIRGLNVPSNVIILSAVEPSFAKLMAGSRFVVITINAGGVRGAGEASACNAMWHGKAVVCADDLSASDHIIDGVTGYIVPAGDALELKARILQLWEDTEGTQNMGRRAHEHVAASLTHEHFLRRLLALSDLLSCYES